MVGCTIDIATCAKSRHDGADLALSFVGVQISGKLAQTHLVRKFIASCDIKFLFRKPPSTGTKRTCGIHVGLGTMVSPAVQGDCRGIVIGGGGGFAIKRLGAVGVMIGTLPGTLFCVCQECVCFVNFNLRFCVGLGVFMMGGGLVILWKIGTLVGISTVGSTVCSTHCSTLCSPIGTTRSTGGGTYGFNWTSTLGRSHSCPGYVSCRGSAPMSGADNLAVMRDMMRMHLSGGELM